MISYIRHIRAFLPYGIVSRIVRLRRAKIKEENAKKIRNIREYFSALDPDNQENQEIREIIDYFKENPCEEHPIIMLPVSGFISKYYGVHWDNTCEMYYVIHRGKKMYYPKKGWDPLRIHQHYKYLCMEQDEDSPHKYETVDFEVKTGDIIADIGAAEGIWALDYADIAGKIYLFECDPDWIEALRKTFEPWKDKVAMRKT